MGISLIETDTELKSCSCCFTGHRSLPRSEYGVVSRRIISLAEELFRRGITNYYAGGALGFDIAASITIINLKLVMPQLTLSLALPCPEYSAKWNKLDVELFKRVMARADEIVYVSGEYYSGCMQVRNKYMVDRSCVCVCYLNKVNGGTYNTVRYAADKKLEIINIAHPVKGTQIGGINVQY